MAKHDRRKHRGGPLVVAASAQAALGETQALQSPTARAFAACPAVRATLSRMETLTPWPCTGLALAGVVLALGTSAGQAVTVREMTSSGQALTVREMTVSEIVAEADLIAVATVAAVRQVWDSAAGRPFTEVTLSDIGPLKGGVESGELTLRFPGGRAPGGLAVVVAGTPHFRLHERVVVFATRGSAGRWSLVGWTQGVYRVVREAGADATVVRGAAGRLTFDELRILIGGEP